MLELEGPGGHLQLWLRGESEPKGLKILGSRVGPVGACLPPCFSPHQAISLASVFRHAACIVQCTTCSALCTNFPKQTWLLGWQRES